MTNWGSGSSFGYSLSKSFFFLSFLPQTRNPCEIINVVQAARRISATSQMLKTGRFPVKFCHVLRLVWVGAASLHLQNGLYVKALVIFLIIDRSMSASGVAFCGNLYLIVDLNTHQK